MPPASLIRSRAISAATETVFQYSALLPVIGALIPIVITFESSPDDELELLPDEHPTTPKAIDATNVIAKNFFMNIPS